MISDWWTRRHDPVRAMLAILIVVAGLLSIITFRAVNTARQAQEDLTEYQQIGCIRGNVIRGYLLIRSDLLQEASGSIGSAYRLFDIAHCEGRKQEPVTQAERDRYLQRLAERMGVAAQWNAVR